MHQIEFTINWLYAIGGNHVSQKFTLVGQKYTFNWMNFQVNFAKTIDNLLKFSRHICAISREHNYVIEVFKQAEGDR